MGERTEILMRIIIAIISGIILGAWRWFVVIITIFNWIYSLFVGRRNKEIAVLSEIWNTQWYIFQRYLLLVTNERPFPFNKLTKKMSNFSRKK